MAPSHSFSVPAQPPNARVNDIPLTAQRQDHNGRGKHHLMIISHGSDALDCRNAIQLRVMDAGQRWMYRKSRRTTERRWRRARRGHQRPTVLHCRACQLISGLREASLACVRCARAHSGYIMLAKGCALPSLPVRWQQLCCCDWILWWIQQY